MKISPLLFFFLAAFTYSQAQIHWNPQWEGGSTQMMEYKFSKVRLVSDTLSKFDSIHARIEAKFLGEYDNKCFFQWQFKDFCYDTTKAGRKSGDEILYELIGKTVNRIPIKFVMSREDYSIEILGEAQTDSIADLVAADIAGKVPGRQSKDDKEMMKGMMKMLYSLNMDKAIYGLIREYYTAYQKSELKPNVKRDVADDLKKDKERAAMVDNASGYTLLEDTDPKVYKLKIHMTMDMSMNKMFKALAAAFAEKDSTNKKPVPDFKDTPADSSSASDIGNVTEQEVIITKGNMNITSLYRFQSTKGNMFGIDEKETEITSLKAIK